MVNILDFAGQEVKFNRILYSDRDSLFPHLLLDFYLSPMNSIVFFEVRCISENGTVFLN